MEFAISDGYEHCDAERWLKVIPQLIAIMDMRYISQFTHGKLVPAFCDLNVKFLEIFCKIGDQHAQGILFSLIFASKNPKGGRIQQQKVAKDVIEKIRDHSRDLVEETELLSREFVSISMLWGDIWLEAIDSKYQFF